MNSEEYEQAYWEARDALYRRGKRVGMPVPGREGLRECSINGTPLTDRELFTEAWGRALADDIVCLNRGLTHTPAQEIFSLGETAQTSRPLLDHYSYGRKCQG
jgi:hypothetical protein